MISLITKNNIKTNFPAFLWWYRTIRSTVNFFLAKLQRIVLKYQIISEYKNVDGELAELVQFTRTNGVSMIPYNFTLIYRKFDINVIYDETNKYNYVPYANEKIYYPNEMNPEEISFAFRQALMEQDTDSPHKYVSDYLEFNFEESAVLLGASDGIFCLSIIDKFNKVYLFEPDKKWHIPMELTLSKYKDKISIISKYASDVTDDSSITLDDFCKLTGPISFVQADIEGYEMQMLNGARTLLSGSRNLKLSISSYHRQNDAGDITSLLNKYGYITKPSTGYMIMWMQLPLRKPYLRQGVIYAKRHHCLK